MTIEIPLQSAIAKPVAPQEGQRVDERVMDKAREFEAVFIAQMLKYSGMGDALSKDAGFGGDAYSSMLLEQYAGKIVENAGFGLAERIYDQLKDREG